MNINEYLKKNLPFYHITDVSNLLSVLKDGLTNKGNPQGVCTVRSSDMRIIKWIAYTQLNLNKFCVFKIEPEKFDLEAKDVKFDITSEYTNPLHSYIRRQKLSVTEEDLFEKEISINKEDLNMFQTLKEKLISENQIYDLEYIYSKPEEPYF